MFGACFSYFYRLCLFIVQMYKRRKIIDVIVERRLIFLLVTTSVIASPMLIINVVNPCVYCHEFYAVMLHEIGHILGLGHPNTQQNINVHGESCSNITAIELTPLKTKFT